MKRVAQMVVYFLAALALSAASISAPKFGSLEAGAAAPGFKVIAADGREVTLADFQGRVVVINFWTLNRGPADLLEATATKYAEQNVAVLAICSGASRAEFEAWVAKYPGPHSYIVAWDPAGADRAERIAPKKFGLTVTPATGVIDAQGKIAGGFIGSGAAAGTTLNGFLREAGVKVPDAPAAPGRPPAEDTTLKAGAAAPDFTANDLGGAPVKLSDFTGKIVVLDFWATWCGPCIASMPHTQSVAAATKSQDVVVLASCTSDTRSAFENWLHTNQTKFPDLRFAHDPAERGPERASAKLYGVRGIPTQFLIGRDGKIVDVFVGYGPGDSRLEDALAKLGVKAHASEGAGAGGIPSP